MKNTDHVLKKCNFNIDTPNRGLKEIKIKGFYNIYASQKCLQRKIESQASIRVPTMVFDLLWSCLGPLFCKGFI